MSEAFEQRSYQVRTDWGGVGIARLAPADVVVVVDVLGFSTDTVSRVAQGEQVELATTWPDVAAVVGAVDPGALVLVGCLRNASAVADAIVAHQHDRGGRVSIAVIPMGEVGSASAGVRFAVEDHLGAGAIIAALSERGIDHTSPEAAVAAEAFLALRAALRHLVGASGSARALGQPDRVADATALDSDTVVPVLREGVFLPLAN